MTSRGTLPRAVAAASLLAVAVAATIVVVVAARSVPAGGHGVGLWPVGLATCGLLALPRRWWPPALLLIGAVGVLSTRAGGLPAGVVLGYGAAILADTLAAALVLGRGGRRRPLLHSDADLVRLLVAAGLGGGAGALLGALTAVVTGEGAPAQVALLLGASQAASQLVIPALLGDLPDHPAMAGPVERSAQRTLLAVTTPLVFLPGHLPSLAFLLVPLLAWGALRVRAREAVLQVAAVGVVAAGTTLAGVGPFVRSARQYGLGVDVRGGLVAAYVLSLALLVVPLVMRVGEHVAARREAASERDMLDRIVRGSHGVAIIATGPDGRITLFNPGAERLLGHRAEDMIGQRTEGLHPPEEIPRLAAALGLPPEFSAVAARLMEPDLAGTEIAFLRADGEVRTHSMTLGRLLDAEGRVVGHLSTSEDITDRVRTQAALEGALERMREVDVVKDAFVSSVSHELRTPITSILGYLEMLGDGSFGPLVDDQQRAVDRIASNSRRLLGLIDDLLVLSRLQGMGDVVPGRAPTVSQASTHDLAAAVRTGCAVVAPAAELGGIVLDLDVPEAAQPVALAAESLERIVINLVGNAVKFTPAGGRVQVRARTTQAEAVLEVRDTGIGIPEEEIGLLFTRFYRSTLAQREAIPGSGLGLSIVHAMVEAAGGTIGVESAVGAGTTVTVRLPSAGMSNVQLSLDATEPAPRTSGGPQCPRSPSTT